MTSTETSVAKDILSLEKDKTSQPKDKMEFKRQFILYIIRD